MSYFSANLNAVEKEPTANPKIFFSYSRTDGEEHAFRLANDLRAAGANVWIDQQDIEPGKLWDLEVEKALNGSSVVLFVATEKSVASNNVLDEVYYAMEENKGVIPVIFHDCRIPFRLNRLQRIDFTGNYDAAFTRLLKTLGLKTAPLAENTESNTAPVNVATVDTDAPSKPAQPVNLQHEEKQTRPASNEQAFVRNENESPKPKSKVLLWSAGAVAVIAALYFGLRTLTSDDKQPADTQKQALVLSKESDSASTALPVSAKDTLTKTEQQSKIADPEQTKKLPVNKPTEKRADPPVDVFAERMAQGKVLFDTSQYAEAMVAFQQALTVKDDAEAFAYLGNCSSSLANYSDAVSYFTKAIERNGQNNKYWAARAMAYHKLKNFKASADDWSQVITLNPKSSEAYVRRGLNRRLVNDASGACDDFATAEKMGNADGRKNYNNFCATTEPVKTATKKPSLQKQAKSTPVDKY